jgi:type II restriction enzyme
MDKLIQTDTYPVLPVLDTLLKDRTTNENIIWATKSYEYLGRTYSDTFTINKSDINGWKSILLQPRTFKDSADQTIRTRSRAEVFTPTWIVNKMLNVLDEEWFDQKGIFNKEITRENGKPGWITNNDSLPFTKKNTLKKYISRSYLEIACGEAPFLVNRYDAATGEEIPLYDRVGVLDRKFRAINENINDYSKWLSYVKIALKSVYGYEFQGDSLLIARINLLLTFVDYYSDKWQKDPDNKLLSKIADIISWNIWQMDGLSDAVPLGAPEQKLEQLTLFEFESDNTEPTAPLSKIKLWDGTGSVMKFVDFKEIGGEKMAKFDVVVGNPPYQIEAPGTSTSDKPVYHFFFEEAKKISSCVEMITPARFLSNAGATPQAWNEKMLDSTHLCIPFYESKSVNVFPGTDIKGGVAISYYNSKKQFEPIKVFSPYPEVTSIRIKVEKIDGLKSSLDDLICTQNKFNLDELNKRIPDLNRKDKRLESNAFNLSVFTRKKSKDSDYKILGLENGKRVYKYVNKELINPDEGNIDCYKVILPKSNGSGEMGEALSSPLIGGPNLGYTRTFISIGKFHDLAHAENAHKYVKTKFCRTMLGVLKITQDNNPGKWKYVPIQDFSNNSDIDWSQSIPEIDQQLYKKYGLSQEEIDFIESHVKEME